MVSPEMLATAPAAMSNTRLWPVPLTASRAAPGPSITALAVIYKSPLVSVIVWPDRAESKRITVGTAVLVSAALMA